MDDNEIRLKILEVAYKNYVNRSSKDSGPMGMDFSDADFFEEIGAEERDNIIRGIEYLTDKGYLEVNTIPGMLGVKRYYGKITPRGIDFIEPPGPFNPKPLVTYIENSDADEPLKQEYRELLNEIKGVLEKAEAKNDTLREKAPAIAETIGSFLAPIINKFLTPGP